MNSIKYALVLGILIGMLGCNGCSDGTGEEVTCQPCGNGGVTCTGAVMECVAKGECDMQGAIGGLVLKIDGTYVQSQVGTSGNWTLGADGAAVLITETAPYVSTSAALVSVEINKCSLASDNAH
jgi:hypothetical protein